MLRFGTGHTSRPPPIGVWDWDLTPVDRPPRLLLSEEFLDLYEFSRDFRDRTVYGPADFFTRVVCISDLLDLDHKIKCAAAEDHSTGTFIIRTDPGNLRELHYAQRCIITASGLRLRGVCRDITNIDDPARLHRQLVENTLLGEVFDLHGVFGAIGDITYPAAPIVLKWLTPHPRGLGHGASTGQTPSVHPDDLPTVIQMITAMRERPHEQATATVRARRAGGGWMKATVTARLLDPRISMSIAVALVFPETISTTEES
ncbi:hypothetical protein [Aldersonia kunmingensis]|uniref:hypothetical protein n=1 Tax=Aldersonia kunmingensis TaxID=408066 RepID=UPI0012ED8535|nr:hypothetical protein [Aldersonia kunmingensis]